MHRHRAGPAGRVGGRRPHAAVASTLLSLMPELLGACVALQFCGGCAAIRKASVAAPPGVMGQKGGRDHIGPAELDQLTRAFADRYVGLLSSTCDALKKGNPDVVQRREASMARPSGGKVTP